jgi:hypothetical protein
MALLAEILVGGVIPDRIQNLIQKCDPTPHINLRRARFRAKAHAQS